uniref:G-protein coupled receptors family 1 profile domain-containing protein n=1 Tax=Mola mola TaxID=94237 RepID=A0A3Q3W777_MOLML
MCSCKDLEYRRLLALLFSASYLSVLLGNALLVYVIHSVELLRSPVYQLTCVIDILAAGAVIPRMRLRLLFDRDEVSLAGCLTQMFFTHFLSSLESTLLLAMALDGYMAICNSYIVAALVGLAGSPCFCGSIPHCYCDHMVMVSLVGLAAIICFVGVDIPLILFSYIEMVERGLWSGSGQQGPLGDTHLMVMMCFYLAGGVTFLSHGRNVPTPTDVNTFLGLMYVLLPAAVNHHQRLGAPVKAVGEELTRIPRWPRDICTAPC